MEIIAKETKEVEKVLGKTSKEYAYALIDKIESMCDYKGDSVPDELVRMLAQLAIDAVIVETNGKEFYVKAKESLYPS